MKGLIKSYFNASSLLIEKFPNLKSIPLDIKLGQKVKFDIFFLNREK